MCSYAGTYQGCFTVITVVKLSFDFSKIKFLFEIFYKFFYKSA